MTATVRPYYARTWTDKQLSHWHVVIELPDRDRIEIFNTKKAAAKRAAQINGGNAQ